MQTIFSSMQTQIATHLKVLKLRFMIVCLKKKELKPVRKGAGNAHFVGTVVKSYEFLLLQG